MTQHDNEQQNFTQMYYRLQEIADYLKSSQIIDIDEILALQQEAKKLYTLLDDMLKKTNEEQSK